MMMPLVNSNMKPDKIFLLFTTFKPSATCLARCPSTTPEKITLKHFFETQSNKKKTLARERLLGAGKGVAGWT